MTSLSLRPEEVKHGLMASSGRKARFSEFLDATIKKGPQVVTRRGIETAILVPIEEWNRLQGAARPSLETLLLAPAPRIENLIPERQRLRRRTPLEFRWNRHLRYQCSF